jgi:hypothetical protein
MATEIRPQGVTGKRMPVGVLGDMTVYVDLVDGRVVSLNYETARGCPELDALAEAVADNLNRQPDEPKTPSPFDNSHETHEVTFDHAKPIIDLGTLEAVARRRLKEWDVATRKIQADIEAQILGTGKPDEPEPPHVARESSE